MVNALTALQKLHIDGLKELHLPDTLGDLCNLTSLSILRSSVRDLPDSIGRLSALRELNIECCRQLKALPDTLGALQLLVSLRVELSGLLSLPNSLGRLRSLERLHIKRCWFSELPASIGELQKLTHLDFTDCHLKRLPESIGRLGNLRVLRVSWTYLKELPSSVCDLSRLERLDLSSYGNLGSLGQLQGLRELKLHSCHHVEVLPDSIGELRLLTTLLIVGCPGLHLPSSASQLTGLEVLHMEKVGSEPLQHLPEGLASFEHLRELFLDLDSLKQCVALGAARLTRLETLSIRGSAIKPSRAGRNLRVFWAGLGSLPGIWEPSPYSSLEALRHLQHLTLRNAGNGLPDFLLKMPSPAALWWYTAGETKNAQKNRAVLEALERKGCLLSVILRRA